MDSISIRSIQHFMYCPHRWGLIEIDKAWAENYFVVKANLLHTRAHSGEKYTVKGKKVLTDITVWDDELDIFGKLDCIEYSGDKYTIVEYKPTKPKNADFNPDDAMQIFAQKICADKRFNSNVHAQVYYADVKKRVTLPFEENYSEYYASLCGILESMRGYLEKGVVPHIRKGQNCNGCSIKDLCMPASLKPNRKKLSQRMLEMLREEL